MKETKKKLIEVFSRKGLKEVHNSYGYKTVHFSLVGKDTEGKRFQALALATCRDSLLRIVRYAINNASYSSYYSAGLDVSVDIEALRLLVICDPPKMDEFKNNLFNGKAILNLLEGINKWQPSSITTVKHSLYKNAWLITGPKEWMLHPQLLSLATWVIRFASLFGPFDTSSLPAFKKSLETFVEKRSDSFRGVKQRR